MAELAAALSQLGARGSRLGQSLYDAAASLESNDSNSLDLEQAAKGVGSFVRSCKQLVTALDNDKSVLSNLALDSLGAIAPQVDGIFTFFQTNSQSSVDQTGSSQAKGSLSHARNVYFLEHMDSLRLTLLVISQLFHTVVVMRSLKLHDLDSPQSDKDVVELELAALKNIVTEQQLSLLRTSNLYYNMQLDTSPAQGERNAVLPLDYSQKTLITESTRAILATDWSRKSPSGEGYHCETSQPKLQDSAASNINMMTDETTGINPRLLYTFHALPSMHLIKTGYDSKRLTRVLRVVSKHMIHLLREWTCLGDEESLLATATLLIAGSSHDSWNKHATVETAPESEDEAREQVDGRDVHMDLPAPVPQRIPNPQSILSQTSFEATTNHDNPETPLRMAQEHPIPAHVTSPRTNFNTMDTTAKSSARSPQILQSIPPIRAAAAAITKEPENGDGLEIPWRLCLHNSHWDFIDATFVGTNTHLQPSEAYRDRRGFTELSASWVCRQAIEEAGHDYLQVQKSIVSGRSSKLETAFIIHQPLLFREVEKLVERTIEIVQEKAEVSRHHERSYQSQAQSQKTVQHSLPVHPTLDRSWSSPAAPILQSPGVSNTEYQSQAAASYLPHFNARHRPPSRRSSTHSQTSHRSLHLHQGASSPTLTFSESDTDSQEERKERRRARRDRLNKSKSSSNKRAMGALAKIGGAVALLEGLEHAF